jgi:hypothetical protein
MPDETQIIHRGHGAPVLIVEDIATEAFTLRKGLRTDSGWAALGGQGTLVACVC